MHQCAGCFLPEYFWNITAPATDWSHLCRRPTMLMKHPSVINGDHSTDVHAAMSLQACESQVVITWPANRAPPECHVHGDRSRMPATLADMHVHKAESCKSLNVPWRPELNAYSHRTLTGRVVLSGIFWERQDSMQQLRPAVFPLDSFQAQGGRT